MPDDTLPAEATPPLSAHEVRVLGCLVEKEITTPDYYPLTLNALVNACNQTSSREPVMSLDEGEVTRALDSLRDKRLASLFKGADSRVPKYVHRFAANDSDLGRPEISVMCVLMLRGPQTAGEIRGRTGRMHEFSSIEEVEGVLQLLMTRSSQALVAKLPRQTGFKEQRYAHRLSGEPVVAAGPEPESPAMPPAAPNPQDDRISKLEAESAALRQELEALKAQFADFRRQFE